MAASLPSLRANGPLSVSVREGWYNSLFLFFAPRVHEAAVSDRLAAKPLDERIDQHSDLAWDVRDEVRLIISAAFAKQAS